MLATVQVQHSRTDSQRPANPNLKAKACACYARPRVRGSRGEAQGILVATRRLPFTCPLLLGDDGCQGAQGRALLCSCAVKVLESVAGS